MSCIGDDNSLKRKANARPEYIGDVDISSYDTIFFGYPICWGDMSMI